MCIRPITIKNPLYLRSQYAIEGGDFIRVPDKYKPKTEFIEVPCGTCQECRSIYYNSLVQRGICESLTSYLYFITLTYDNEHLPSLVLPHGQTVYYCDYSHIQDLFKRLRHNKVIDRDFRYLVAMEYGDTNCRPHFHIILFVAKLYTDNSNTPFIIEKQLFDNVKKYYAVNIGTRKQPIYKSLFTYKIRYTSSGVKTNYFVKYVEPTNSALQSSEIDNLTYVKTLKYLLSYVNKGSKFDDTIYKHLSELNDPILCKQLKRLLSSRVRYSKGFGLGFNNGLKCFQERTFVKSNYNTIVYSTLEFPPTLQEYLELIELSSVDFDIYVKQLYSKAILYSSLRDYLSSIYERDLYMFYGYLHYFPYDFTLFYQKHFRKSLLCPNISYFYYFLQPYKYVRSKFRCSVPYYSVVYDYIRNSIIQGLNAKVPFITFVYHSSNSFQPLCKFYKERFSSLQDIVDMFSICGFQNYEDWITSFNKYINITKVNRSFGNTYKHYEQVNCISYDPHTDLYNLLFTSVK